ncbi:MAG: methyltransferase domain-containing protein [Patescibacteria group bacterium]
MKTGFLDLLKCPSCLGALKLESSKSVGLEILEGHLLCNICNKRYPITRGIPRFVGAEHYSKTFGFEWQKHSETQYDSISGQNASEKRLFRETKWPRVMKGEWILEAGCGGGRFTEHLLKTGATVVSLDASIAVDENFKHHGEKDNSLIIQADITKLSFEEGTFDRALCIGVLQHTPDPFKSLAALVTSLKPGGSMVADIYDKPPIYRRMFNTRYWIRPLTKRLPPAMLYKLVSWYISLMWPLAKFIHNLPFGVKINHKLLIAEHFSYKNLSGEMQKEWAVLDTFDWLSPWYELPQTKETVMGWCQNLPLKDVDITYGYGGIEMRATRI